MSVENRKLFLPCHVYLAPQLGMTPLEYQQNFWHQKRIDLDYQSALFACYLPADIVFSAADEAPTESYDTFVETMRDRMTNPLSKGPNRSPKSRRTKQKVL